MKTTIKILFLLVISGILLYSCRREKADTETDSASDENLANRLYFATFTEAGNQAISVDEVGIHKGKLPLGDTITDTTFVNGCVTITVDTFITTTGYAVAEIDFGTTGCFGNDGKWRKGRIILRTGGFWFTETDSIADGTWISVALQNFYTKMDIQSDYMQMAGSLTIVYNYPATFTFTVTGAEIWTSPNHIQWHCSFSFKEIHKDDPVTTSVNEQIVLIDGSTGGTTKNGQNYTCVITKSLRQEGTCKWITSGTFELTPEGKPVRVVDYGDGTCDNVATLTVKGLTVQFILD